MAWNLGDHDWPRTNAQGLQLESGAWQLLCSCHATNSWEKLPLAWLSMLAPKGTLLRKTGISDSVFIVLETSQHGVLRWPARREYNQELQLELWQPSTADDASATWEPVLDAADWEHSCMQSALNLSKRHMARARGRTEPLRLFAQRLQVSATSCIL